MEFIEFQERTIYYSFRDKVFFLFWKFSLSQRAVNLFLPEVI